MTDTEIFYGTPAFLSQETNDDYRTGFFENAGIFVIETKNKKYDEVVEKIKKAMKDKKMMKIIADKNIIQEIE